jgi:hypothetical protein
LPADRGWHAYMNWAETAEAALRGIFVDPEIVAAIRTDRYWHIASHSTPARMAALISAEVEAQSARLKTLVARLRGYLALAAREGTLVIPDTNILLHFQRIDHVDWGQVMHDPQAKIRVVLPLVVLDELDRKRYEGSNTLKRRARTAVKPLTDLASEIESLGYGRLPKAPTRWTVEYLTDERGHRRQFDADAEILDRALFLHQVTGGGVNVATADLGMQVRAMAWGQGVRAIAMPDKYRRDQGDED